MSDVSHYMTNGRECIEQICDHMGEEEYRGYLKGNVLKYLYREGDKADAQRDLEKAADYACRLAYGCWLSEVGEEVFSKDGKLVMTVDGKKVEFPLHPVYSGHVDLLNNVVTEEPGFEQVEAAAGRTAQKDVENPRHSCLRDTAENSDNPASRYTEGYSFNFPPNNRTGSVFDQLKHASGEIVEAMQASSELGYITMLVEVLDAIECLEGVLRQSSECNLKIAYQRHYEKCLRRGNYLME